MKDDNLIYSISDFENRLIVFEFYNQTNSFFIWISITNWWMATTKFYVQIQINFS
jgi:hypothetical protein